MFPRILAFQAGSTSNRDDLIVSVYACGGLTDLVIEGAIVAGARMAVLPCCHDLAEADLGGLQGCLDGPLAMDVARVARLRSRGYRVITQLIPEDITPKNRLLLAEPESRTLSLPQWSK